jgi:hypothetical protein
MNCGVCKKILKQTNFQYGKCINCNSILCEACAYNSELLFSNNKCGGCINKYSTKLLKPRKIWRQRKHKGSGGLVYRVNKSTKKIVVDKKKIKIKKPYKPTKEIILKVKQTQQKKIICKLCGKQNTLNGIKKHEKYFCKKNQNRLTYPVIKCTICNLICRTCNMYYHYKKHHNTTFSLK